MEGHWAPSWPHATDRQWRSPENERTPMPSLSPLQWIQAVIIGSLVVGFFSISIYDRYEARRRAERLRDKWAPGAAAPPAVSVVVVAHNGEERLVETVNACLGLDYPRFEVVVVNDGSVDGTLDRLDDVFGLTGTEPAGRESVATKPVRAVYRATSVWGLRVVDKCYGGPTDALAAGLNEARNELVCEVQIDAPPDADALRRLVEGDRSVEMRVTRPVRRLPREALGVA